MEAISSGRNPSRLIKKSSRWTRARSSSTDRTTPPPNILVSNPRRGSFFFLKVSYFKRE